METQEFQDMIRARGEELYRDMPWRNDPSPYKVLVSELMLQQTQVARVIPKFESFMRHYPTPASLAESSLADVLGEWSGLGYNRRAKFLWQAARDIGTRFGGSLPSEPAGLVSLPGVGINTASAILNYAYQQPTPYVETNIRTVYFHHFFADRIDVSDREVLALVASTMDRTQPREWFWALMDYGAHLKATAGGRLDMSRHYKKQGALKGSMREMRGRIIRELTLAAYDGKTLGDRIGSDHRFDTALQDLEAEGMIERRGTLWQLAGHKG